MAIAVACGEIHRAERALAPEETVDQAPLLEEVAPVEGRHHAQARDHVAHRHVGAGLALVLGADELVRGGAAGREPLVEPARRRRRDRILVPEPMGEPHGE